MVRYIILLLNCSQTEAMILDICLLGATKYNNLRLILTKALMTFKIE